MTDMSYLDINGRSFELLLERNRANISGYDGPARRARRGRRVPRRVHLRRADWLMSINVARYTEWCFLDERLSFVRKHTGNNTSANPTNGLDGAARHQGGVGGCSPGRCRPTGRWPTTGGDYRWTIQNARVGLAPAPTAGSPGTSSERAFPCWPDRRDKAYVLRAAAGHLAAGALGRRSVTLGIPSRPPGDRGRPG